MDEPASSDGSGKPLESWLSCNQMARMVPWLLKSGKVDDGKEIES